MQAVSWVGMRKSHKCKKGKEEKEKHKRNNRETVNEA